MCREIFEKRIISESYVYLIKILSYFFYDLTSDEHLNPRIKTPRASYLDSNRFILAVNTNSKIKLKVHLHWTKANAEAICSLIFVAA